MPGQGVGQLVPSQTPPASLYYQPGNWATLPNYTLYTPDHLVFPYIQYDLDIEYLWDNGQLQGPVSPLSDQVIDPSQVLPAYRQATPSVQVSAPYGRKIVKFSIARRGVMPVIPYPWSPNPNEVLVLARLNPQAPLPSEDGYSSIYSVSGLYVYNLLQPYWATDGVITGGSTAVSTLQSKDNIFPPSNFQSGYSNILP